MYFNRNSWQSWLIHVRDTYISPLETTEQRQRRLIVLEDTPRYREWFDECIVGDTDFESVHVVFVSLSSAEQAAPSAV